MLHGNYSRTSLQRTPMGPCLTVRPTGVRSFAGVPYLEWPKGEYCQNMIGGGGENDGPQDITKFFTIFTKSFVLQCKVTSLPCKQLNPLTFKTKFPKFRLL